MDRGVPRRSGLCVFRGWAALGLLLTATRMGLDGTLGCSNPKADRYYPLHSLPFMVLIHRPNVGEFLLA